MGLRRFVVVCTILVAALSYAAYSPLPPGYSASSRIKYQLMMMAWKLVEILCDIGSFLRLATHEQLCRGAFGFLLHHIQPSDTHGVVTREAVFDGVRVKIYEPRHAVKGTLPGMMYFHGGGWTYGGIDSIESIVIRLCHEAKAIIASVDYRLAPEFPFPAAIDDSTIATKYFLKNAAEFNVDPNRIAVVGDSAGGNLATTVALRLRDEKFPIRVKLQVLIYPVTQGLDFNLPSMIQSRDGPFLTRDFMTFFTAMYIEGKHDHIPDYSDNRHVTKSFRQTIAKTYMNLAKLPKEFLAGYVEPEFPDGDEKLWNAIKGKLLHPYYSPLAADNVENLPEAYIFTANFDPLRDEGWLYAVKLREAKNKVTIYNAEIGFHPIANFIGVLPEADVMFAEITKFVVDNL